MVRVNNNHGFAYQIANTPGAGGSGILPESQQAGRRIKPNQLASQNCSPPDWYNQVTNLNQLGNSPNPQVPDWYTQISDPNLIGNGPMPELPQWYLNVMQIS